MLDTAVIGAGPFGLSIAAHLKARGVEFRIFGSPMQTWLHQMPREMRLKSEGFASTLYDPDSSFTLAHFCRENGLPYADTGLPVPLETFSSYGLEFQKRFVPELEKRDVRSLCRSGAGFCLELTSGESVMVRKVVVAVGLTHFQHLPPVLSQIPRELLTHSSQHRTFDEFCGREVVVIGSGASAADSAALLHRSGAFVQLVSRRTVIPFHDPPAPGPRSLWDLVRWPLTGLGPGWTLLFYARFPLLFCALPQSYRLSAVKQVLGPAPAWFVRDEVMNHVRLNTGVRLTRAEVRSGRVHLHLNDAAGAPRTVAADHVIAGTGYCVDLRRLRFLAPELLGAIRTVEDAPVLSAHFESSVPNLYFVGVASANTFGPLVRFAYGAGFTARRLSRYLARSRRSMQMPSARRSAGTAEPGQSPAEAVF
jgi:hypothetical protein